MCALFLCVQAEGAVPPRTDRLSLSSQDHELPWERLATSAPAESSPSVPPLPPPSPPPQSPPRPAVALNGTSLSEVCATCYSYHGPKGGCMAGLCRSGGVEHCWCSHSSRPPCSSGGPYASFAPCVKEEEPAEARCEYDNLACAAEHAAEVRGHEPPTDLDEQRVPDRAGERWTHSTRFTTSVVLTCMLESLHACWSHCMHAGAIGCMLEYYA